MIRIYFTLFFVLFAIINVSFVAPAASITTNLFYNEFSYDSLPANQPFMNGRIWRDIYTAVKENQFLFTTEFLPGKVTMNGKTWNTSRLRYDIMNDEIMTVTDKGHILQLNKEMVENFTLTYQYRIYNFIQFKPDSLNNESGYFNILYKGRSALLVRYQKAISKRGPGKNYEDFVQSEKVYIIKDGIFHQVRNNSDFKKIVSDRKNEIKAFMKGNRMKISRKSPDTYKQVLEYYDTLK
jgi:hypothetical protein